MLMTKKVTRVVLPKFSASALLRFVAASETGGVCQDSLAFGKTISALYCGRVSHHHSESGAEVVWYYDIKVILTQLHV